MLEFRYQVRPELTLILIDSDWWAEDHHGNRRRWDAASAREMAMLDAIERWREAFYREERRAVSYHNQDLKDCGHPVSCLRNGKDGVRCLMCEQQAEIASLQETIKKLSRYAVTK